MLPPKDCGVQAEARCQEPGDAGAENADNDVADEAEAVTLDQHTGQPAGDGADDDPGKNGLWLEH